MGQKLGRKLSNDEVAYAVHRSRAPKIKGISTAEVREGQLAHRRENACGLRGRESFDSVANEELITGNPPGNLPQFSHDPVKLQRRRSESGGSCPFFGSKLGDFLNKFKVLCHCLGEQFLTHLLKLPLKVSARIVRPLPAVIRPAFPSIFSISFISQRLC